MARSEVIDKLKRYKELLSRQFSFEEVILYGSYATGNFDENSDVDVAIVVDGIEGDSFNTRPLLWKIRRKVDDRIEPILIDKNHDESGFLANIRKTGVKI
jgi:predicted nucleotidyltransferase